jgi:hypothetical protein
VARKGALGVQIIDVSRNDLYELSRYPRICASPKIHRRIGQESACRKYFSRTLGLHLYHYYSINFASNAKELLSLAGQAGRPLL